MKNYSETQQGPGQRLVNLYKREGMVKTVQILTDFPWLQYSWLLPGPTNNMEIRVLHLRRSGSHAIINWIRSQVKGRHCFLNNCKKNANPFSKCIKAESVVKNPLFEHSHLIWKHEVAGKHSKKGVLIYNYEDKHLKDVVTEQFEEHRTQWLGESLKKFDVIILRDPFNIVASKLNWAYQGNRYTPSLDSFPELVQLWKEYAREFVGETNYLNNKVTINYNKWFVDQEYRMQLSDKLGLSWNDQSLNKVAKWGIVTWGDSFDGLEYDGKASQMKVLERWKNFKDDSFYLSLFKDRELIDLSEAIFGHLPETEILINQ